MRSGLAPQLRVAHAMPVRLGPRVLVAASRRNRLSLLYAKAKFAVARTPSPAREVRAGLALRALPESELALSS